MIAYVIQGLTLGASAGATPGPFQAFLFSRAVRDGWRRTLPVIFAPILSDGPIIAIVLLALARIPDWMLSLLQVAGGAFLIFLAFSAFRAARQIDDSDAPDEQAGASSLVQAALINALSPGPWIYWALITGPIVIEAWRGQPAHAGAFLAGFYVALLSINAALLMVFSATRRFGGRAREVLAFAAALILAGFGIYQLASGAIALLG